MTALWLMVSEILFNFLLNGTCVHTQFCQKKFKEHPNRLVPPVLEQTPEFM